jgi:phospholipase/carboxylesterase
MIYEPITHSTLKNLVVGPRLENSAPPPALLLLHGRGADENDLLALTPFFDPRFLIVSVRAPFLFPPGGYTWYEVHQALTPHPEQFAESYNRLVDFIADMKRTFRLDPGRVFLMGFSMGAVMSYALALTKPEEVAGVIAHSGYIPEGTELSFKWDKLRHTSFFLAHGRFDMVIPAKLGRRAHDLLLRAGARILYRQYPIAHQISEESLNDLSAWLKEQLASHSSV